MNRWLDVGEDDAVISRELPLTEVVEEPVVPDGEHINTKKMLKLKNEKFLILTFVLLQILYYVFFAL